MATPPIAPATASASASSTTSADTLLDDGHPFVSQDTWIAISDHFVNKIPPPRRPLTLSQRDGAAPPIVFVRTDLLLDMLDSLRTLPTPFVLITASNDDHCPPYLRFPPSKEVKEAVDAFLAEAKLVKWFAKNPCVVSPLIEPLPLGPKWQWKSTAFFGEDKAAHLALFHRLGADPERSFWDGPTCKPKWLFHNYRQTTKKALYSPHRGVREICKAALLRNGFEWSEFTDFETYLGELAAYKFCAAPPGRGIDTHRCWEALMHGVVPVVLHSPLDALLDALPVVFVEDWISVTPELLSSAHAELHALSWSVAYVQESIACIAAKAK